jgi:hypothetical protein
MIHPPAAVGSRETGVITDASYRAPAMIVVLTPVSRALARIARWSWRSCRLGSGGWGTQPPQGGGKGTRPPYRPRTAAANGAREAGEERHGTGVALGALTRNTIGAIVAAIAWTLFVEQVILAAIVPGIEKWLPTGAAIGLTNAPGPDPAHSLPAAVAGLVLAGTVLAGYGIAMLLAASRTTIRRDVG